jgi:hypothetical protein
MAMMFSIPVGLNYNGHDYIAHMGPFERSIERDFALVANKRALAECNDVGKLREVAGNLLEGWSNMQEAFTALMKENLELRQAMQMQQHDLDAAEALLGEAGDAINRMSAEQQRSSQARRFLWPFGW